MEHLSQDRTQHALSAVSVSVAEVHWSASAAQYEQVYKLCPIYEHQECHPHLTIAATIFHCKVDLDCGVHLISGFYVCGVT